MAGVLRWCPLALFFCGLSLVWTCASPSANEPTGTGESDLFIDPDKRALPKESSDDLSSKPVSDVTLDGSVGALPQANQPESKMPKPSARSPKQEVVSGGTKKGASDQRIMGAGTQKRFVKAAELNIRAEPNRFSKIVGRLAGGDEVLVTIEGGWAKLSEGQWIRSRWLVKKSPRRFAEGAANTQGLDSDRAADNTAGSTGGTAAGTSKKPHGAKQKKAKNN